MSDDHAHNPKYGLLQCRLKPNSAQSLANSKSWHSNSTQFASFWSLHSISCRQILLMRLRRQGTRFLQYWFTKQQASPWRRRRRRC
uniref:Zinc finger CCCH domain-containing protein 48 n=1 Tax=Rhizophora mucronata TaxID=61149 RepID=A0A2P2ITL9_RHIMU